jgi:hypothetical protein
MNTTNQENIDSLVEKTLNHSNWTGLTLRQLVEAGRVGTEPIELLQWVKSVNGSAKDLKQLKEYKTTASVISVLLS